MSIKFEIIFFLSIAFLSACQKDTAEISEIPEMSNIDLDSTKVEQATILSQLATNYSQLSEKEIAISFDKTVYAQYTNPTERYRHGILGDAIESGQLVVVVDSIFYEFTLSENYVFEDIRPRLYDVDGDGVLEFITIRTNVSLGGGIVIYKVRNNRLEEYAIVSEIGQSNRWLNIVAINDLDNDGIVELVWIETPHIGGILKVAKIQEGVLSIIAETRLYSNHAIGERNLCLSILTQQNEQKIFYVPNQNRSKIVGFSFQNNQLQFFEDIIQEVDFSKPLIEQYTFTGVLEGENNCINP